MKKILYTLLIVLTFGAYSCQDFEELNVDPNNPAVVSTATLMTGAEKKMMDNIYDNWFSGRQALVYAQYWSQRTYTEEDRYQIRESVNNNYFNTLYTVAGNLQHIIDLNTNEATKAKMAVYGDNANQIAAAKILKVWLMQLLADTWGSIPYSEAFKLDQGQVYAKYDDLQALYTKFLAELNEAISSINTGAPVFVTGDMIYNGDAAKWKKFANSLKCRIALRLSKVDPQWKTYVAEALNSGVFTSNADNAVYKYSTEDPNQSYFYRGFFVDRRNDFSICKPMVDLLKGQRDTLNNKQHPWNGVIDPRLKIFTTSRRVVITKADSASFARYGKVYVSVKDGATVYEADSYRGIPYGLKSSEMTAAIRNASPSYLTSSSLSTALVLQPNFFVPYMTYAEICFIKSEYEGFSAAEYEKGVRASLEYWNKMNLDVYKAQGVEKTSLTDAQINAYVDAVNDVVNAETVATQKYIHLYMSGTEAWAEYRRTGYPSTLVKPNEVSYKVGTTAFKFEPLSDTKGDLPGRVKYPTNESTLNGENFNAAVAKLQDATNNYYSKMFWDVRTSANPNPANK